MGQRYVAAPKPIDLVINRRVVELWNTGNYSYGAISDIITRELSLPTKLSRSTIAGKLTRARTAGIDVLRLGSPPNMGGHRGNPATPKKEKVKAVAVAKTPREKKAAAVNKIKLVKSDVATPKVVKKAGVPSMTLEDAQAVNGCRWPSGDRPDMRFCGGAKPAIESYCDEHKTRSVSAASYVNREIREQQGRLRA